MLERHCATSHRVIDERTRRCVLVQEEALLGHRYGSNTVGWRRAPRTTFGRAGPRRIATQGRPRRCGGRLDGMAPWQAHMLGAGHPSGSVALTKHPGIGTKHRWAASGTATTPGRAATSLQGYSRLADVRRLVRFT
jgi:hypothetical protein